ncbi:hypothetical protein FHX81_1882 [Saccharothrix saharensis]|uniref:Uncharacterized protein n=1 Tax=Saccharothrix saharensis TaxID=571190 RepID=A0A543J9S6_9PSEU|nr:hypothetical protein [Saccharothrix saharensis]TQM79573.1 hypothetical protein FHX81_1882 [Saccharothrix saharensis]
MRVTRGSEVVVGDWPTSPEVVALLECSGALLAWDVLVDAPVPAARVHDVDRAAEWLWEVYGDAADAILGGAAEVGEPGPGDRRVRDACRRVAQLNWASAWWPASVTAGVPAFNTAVLHAELAVEVSAVEHLLDDPDAVERALAAVVPLDASDPALTALAGRVSALAEDYGVVLPAAEVPRQSGFALAAGGLDGGRGGIAALSGSSTVDWSLVPHGAVDAAAPATWAVVRRQGRTVVEVSVVPGPKPGARLAARFGDVEVALDGVDEVGRLTGSTPVSAAVLLLPPDRRELVVYAPDFAEPAAPDPAAGPRRAAIIAYARARTTSPTATLTERTAR